MIKASSGMKFWLKVVLCVIATNGIGAVEALITIDKIPTWYVHLERPPGVPPNSVFSPVWTFIYSLIGLSIAWFWHFVESGPEKREGWIWMACQMGLNYLWTPVFFGANWLGVALIVIVALVIAIAGTIRVFLPLDRVSALLLVPHLLWVSYATYLNAGFWWLNR